MSDAKESIDLQVGDIVYLREWDDLAREFPVELTGVSKQPIIIFDNGMKISRREMGQLLGYKYTVEEINFGLSFPRIKLSTRSRSLSEIRFWYWDRRAMVTEEEHDSHELPCKEINSALFL